MSDYRRLHVPGGTYFFTVNLARRGETPLVERIDALRAAYRAVSTDMPFATRAIVVLPDHLHAVWTLPEGQSDFSERWKRIKRGVSIAAGESPRSASKHAKGDVGVWQRRFRERSVRDEAELSACLRYVWGDPVKHGFVVRAVDWLYSSIHREVRTGRLPEHGI